MSNWQQQAPPGYPSAAAGPSAVQQPGWGAPPPMPQQGGYYGAGAGDDDGGKKPGAGAPMPPPGGFMGGLPPVMPMRPPVAVDPESQQMEADMAFATTGMRNAFVRKVFAIVALQLLITAGFAAACLYSPNVKRFVQRNPAMYYVAWGVSFASVLLIACVEKARRQFPLNVVTLGVFTLAEAYLVGMITSFHNVEAVMLAFLVTGAAVLALTLFAINTKIDVTRWGSLLFVALIVLIVLSIIGIFWRTRILYLAISGIAALVFSAYLVYDIQAIMGGRRAAYSPDDWVAAALAIYLDVINLFIAILNIIGLTSNN